MSTQTTDLAAWLDELEEARKAATPGPWEVATAPSEDLHPGCDYVVPVITGDGPTSEANARFIAEAYAALPELVAAVRGVLALAEEMEQAGGLPDTHGEFDRGVAAHQRDAAARIRVVLAGDS